MTTYQCNHQIGLACDLPVCNRVPGVDLGTWGDWIPKPRTRALRRGQCCQVWHEHQRAYNHVQRCECACHKSTS